MYSSFTPINKHKYLDKKNIHKYTFTRPGRNFSFSGRYNQKSGKANNQYAHTLVKKKLIRSHDLNTTRF